MEFNCNHVKEEINRISWDTWYDYCPVVSTVSNACDIAQKILFSCQKSPEEIKKDYYCDYICNKKSFLKCAVLLIPVIGQLIIYSYDKLKGHETKVSLKNATNEQKNDEAYVLQFIQENLPSHNLSETDAKNPLLNNQNFMLKVMQIYGHQSVLFASDVLKANPDFLLAILKNDSIKKPQYNTQQNGLLAWAKPTPIARENILEACRNNNEMLTLADELYRYEESALQESDFNAARNRWERIGDFWSEVFTKNPKAYDYWIKHNPNLQSNVTTICNTIKEYRNNVFYQKASPEVQEQIEKIAKSDTALAEILNKKTS